MFKNYFQYEERHFFRILFTKRQKCREHRCKDFHFLLFLYKHEKVFQRIRFLQKNYYMKVFVSLLVLLFRDFAQFECFHNYLSAVIDRDSLLLIQDMFTHTLINFVMISQSVLGALPSTGISLKDVETSLLLASYWTLVSPLFYRSSADCMNSCIFMSQNFNIIKMQNILWQYNFLYSHINWHLWYHLFLVWIKKYGINSTISSTRTKICEDQDNDLKWFILFIFYKHWHEYWHFCFLLKLSSSFQTFLENNISSLNTDLLKSWMQVNFYSSVEMSSFSSFCLVEIILSDGKLTDWPKSKQSCLISFYTVTVENAQKLFYIFNLWSLWLSQEDFSVILCWI